MSDLSQNKTIGSSSVDESAAIANPLHVRLIAAVVLGLTLHHFVFRKGEWHLQAPTLFALWILSHPLLFIIELVLGASSPVASAWNTLYTTGCFTAAIFGSIASYRLFFHRLAAFPGPTLAKVSKLWHTVKCSDSKNYLVLGELQKQYGDFVRTGPNEITSFLPEALYMLDGPGNKNIKSDIYDFLVPYEGVSSIPLPRYELLAADHAEKLAKVIGAGADQGKPIPFSSLMFWYSFDVMGMFALGKSFNMVVDGQWHDAITKFRRGMEMVGRFSAVPWLARIGTTYMKHWGVAKDWHTWTAWCRDQMKDRVEINDESTCIATYVIADAAKKGSLDNAGYVLGGEAIVAIIAGSDTIAASLIYIFYELAMNPLETEKLHAELQGVDIDDRRALEKLSHLNAVINEGMRLHPALPTGGYRILPAEGATVAGRYIPGGTTLVAPRYHIFRSERCYERPNEFIPERWYSRPELVKDSRSFLPFAQGRYSCLGKTLAYTEMRVVIAQLVSNYRFSFPEGVSGFHVADDMQDNFTATPGDMELVFTRR
ncbi:hypothetical protein S7711_03790 [Stachybotrys chartarum IBT 7711]|uniref:Cytochrome P450 n=1 Tax=Stachybotrys chartarum (strain CBS 109288 / IBT 7711) TaxID=1280523 RepID=A0A084AU71_STACB|nr:hypothetical protein S7711_03790 [Stachybotrys chartarum IBT 7711]